MAIQSIGPLYRINGPLPRPPRYTLVGAAELDPESDEHWANGVQVHGYIPDVGSVFGVCSPDGPQEKLSQETPNPLPSFAPLTVYLAEACASRTIGSNEDFKKRVSTVFAAVESGVLEHEFWTGEFLPDNPHLADGNATVLAVGATGMRNALALLEEAIAETYREGVIHMPAALAAAYSTIGGDVLHDERGKLFTKLGTPVVPGAGYPGTGTDGAAVGATESWAFATGPVGVLRSEPFVMPPELAQALDRETNEVVYRAERYYIPFWDTALQAAVLVDRCVDSC